MTAKLQRGLTRKDLAAQYRVSERLLYMACKLLRSGRVDLMSAVERGELSINAALRLLDQKPQETGVDRLCRAWRSASAHEREAFMNLLVQAGGAR